MNTITLAPFGQLPAVQVTAPDGAQAIVTLYGAHLVSWKSAGGAEHLFCSARSALDGSRAIRGGVPVIFPQFNERGTGMRHGFARVSDWALVDSGIDGDTAFAVFALEPHDLSPDIAQAWPHDFMLRLRVTVGGDKLAMAFEVHNRGAAPFAFSCALHTYHLVDQVADVRIDGLRDSALAIGDALDEIFYGVPPRLTLRAGPATLLLEQEGFTDAVVWNPGAANAAALVDLEDDEYRRFVCIEPAVIEPRTLQAGEAWLGRYSIES
ncbi:MAG: putative glucose-6-phosphate 1-epimerase [Massilia sp.]|jgi:glucose-6-phosphate 1-epimerase|nr:putative glucose-6-phosphate 1-epimerase [Massilia sp.]